MRKFFLVFVHKVSFLFGGLRIFFSLSLVLDSLIMLCLAVVFMFLCLDFFGLSKFIIFIKFLTFLVIISSAIFSVPPFFSSPLGTLVTLYIWPLEVLQLTDALLVICSVFHLGNFCFFVFELTGHFFCVSNLFLLLRSVLLSAASWFSSSRVPCACVPPPPLELTGSHVSAWHQSFLCLLEHMNCGYNNY